MKELLQDFLLVKKEEIKQETEGGFIKPGGHKEKQSVAVVVDISDDLKGIIEINDRVLTADHSIREVQIDGEIFNFVRQKDLIAIIS